MPPLIPLLPPRVHLQLSLELQGCQFWLCSTWIYRQVMPHETLIQATGHADQEPLTGMPATIENV